MIKSIVATDTLEELTKQIQAAPDVDELRTLLIAEYHRLFHYTNIIEWNELVRVCEALAIAEKWINGAYYTELRTCTFQQLEGSTQRWSIHKDSYVITEGSDRTNYGIPSVASQSNQLPKNPLRLVRSGNYQRSAQPFIDRLSSLRSQLDEHMRPELYGDFFSYLGISCYFSHHDEVEPSLRYEYFHETSDVPEGFEQGYFIRPKYDVGKLATRKGELKMEITRHFTRAEGELPLDEQQKLFQVDLLHRIDVLEEKLRKKKLNYRVDLLRQDAQQILERWMKHSDIR